MPPVPKPRKSKSAKQGRNNKALLIVLAGIAVVVVAIAAGGILLTRGDSSSGSNGGSASADAALIAGIPQQGTVLGQPDATVTMHLFEDIQCPYCRQFTEDALPAIVKDYVRTGKIKLDWRGLAFIGADSDKALRIALAAGNQGKLWQVVELFYARQGEEGTGWVTDALVDEILADVAGLDAAKVKVDAKSAAVSKTVVEIQAEAQERTISGTPSFFLQLGSDAPYQIDVDWKNPDAFRPALDDALKG